MTKASDTDALIRAIGWSQRHVANLLGCGHTLVRRWANGDAETPEAVVSWLKRWATFAERNPAPTDWRTK